VPVLFLIFLLRIQGGNVHAAGAGP
jgi:hypothetical protein